MPAISTLPTMTGNAALSEDIEVRTFYCRVRGWLLGYALDRVLKWEAIEIDGSLDARDSPPTPAQGKAAQTFILCSSPPNWTRLCDLGACSRALTARLSTLPHRFTFGFPALCRTG
jgi:hypothetical protein